MVDLNEARVCTGCARRFRGTTERCIVCLLNPPKVPIDIASTLLKQEFDENLRALLQLCHPDKHEHSAMSRRITEWLLSKRPVKSKR